ncbi:MAG: ABC transporter permease [Eubacteriales bacterium]|nr:ABC transporter permease [Eubacteriales bacterium]
MNVKNRKCIRHLSFKTLWASRKRNLIAVIAIILTSILFTSLFTIVLSINSSYEAYQFRQIGGYCHGTFKDVTDEQAAAISAHSKVKETGVRKVIGFCSDGVFAKVPAEVSYMDKNCTKWSYAEPDTGRSPENGMEIAMDTGALKLLGITPELGAKIPLTYLVGDKEQIAFSETDTFTLVGYWDYDSLMPVHYLNISGEYAEKIEAKGIAEGMEPFRTDLNVMMASSVNIRGQMEQVDTDLGYTWDSFTEDNSVRIGVNWGYTTSQMDSGMDSEMILAMAAFLLLVIFTGYLIIYNIFQISVSGDIRFYGLLKTIGTTPGQLKRIIRHQALLLCAAGIPAGLLLGYGTGAALTPVVMKSSSYGSSASTLSTSPLIFIGSALFTLATVLLSCSRPGRLAAKVSPVEATKYTEITQIKKKSRPIRGAKVYQMAFANLERNKLKTFLVIVSLALSVTLLNELYAFVNGFDMEKYVSSQTCADFIVSSPDYFRFNTAAEEYLSEEDITDINSNTDIRLSGSGYTMSGHGANIWISEDTLRSQMRNFFDDETITAKLDNQEHRDGLVMADVQIEGLDISLFEKLSVIDGDLAPLSDPDSHTIAVTVDTDDYGNISNPEDYPKVGDTLTAAYISDAYYIDSRTGEKSDENTPEEFLKWHIEKSYEVDYTVCALVTVPYSMSYRYSLMGYSAILSAEALKKDSRQPVLPLFYLFDTPDEAAEAEAESYLAQLTADDFSSLMYESKATVREEFKEFQHMFLLVGGLLCAIIGIVGILNYFNAIMTGILSRRREFAVLQSVGMTNRQLKTMLIYEGLFYSLGSVAAALVLSLILGPLAGSMINHMFWFCNYRFTVVPVLFTIPVFTLLGWLVPSVLYGQAAAHSVVERLRETD